MQHERSTSDNQGVTTTVPHLRDLQSFGLPMLCLLSAVAMACHSEEEDAFDEAAELDPGGPLGKADAIRMSGLPVHGNYASTRVWEARNRWEDTDTPAARAAGIAWPADSGLTWDEKYSAWVRSLAPIDGDTVSTTFELSTPWGKTLPAPKLDCADVALVLRVSFAAWYNLPFYVVGFDGGRAVYFGHFGIRTKNGRWNGMPRFALAYDDFSHMSPQEALYSWPTDDKLRRRGVQKGDDQPFLGEGARTGTYLDEIHLNKRAGHFIRLMLIFTGSMHLADSRNTYNLTPSSIQAGDVMLWRWQALGVGHTMFTVRVDEIGDGRLQAQSVFGNLPPNQPSWVGPVNTRLDYTNPQGGGRDGTTDYAVFNGGLKRFRVAKNVGGRWTNTFMAADESSWIDDTDHERMHRRPEEFEGLLGEVEPEQLRDALLSVIEQKRQHLRNFPASCAARSKREDAFEHLYELMDDAFDMAASEVDAEFRIFEDYVFAELDYEQSKTCCWNSTNHTMYETIMDLNEQAQLEAGDACVPPIVFKARNGDYEVFRDHDATGWVEWSEDESCTQRGVLDDAEASHAAISFCEWSDAVGGDELPPAGASCQGHCGESSSDGTCFCDDLCSTFGDCCGDFAMACQRSVSPSSTTPTVLGAR